jgi:hypothetical protein
MSRPAKNLHHAQQLHREANWKIWASKSTVVFEANAYIHEQLTIPTKHQKATRRSQYVQYSLTTQKQENIYKQT